VILLQTTNVLSHPWVLLAAYCACLDNIPLLCVVVEDAGYDFGQARAHLEHLDQNLDSVAREQLKRTLSSLQLPNDLGQMKQLLVTTIPNIISVVYDPEGTTNELIATVHDIRDKQTLLLSRTRRGEHERRRPTLRNPFRPRPAAEKAPSDVMSCADATSTKAGSNGASLNAERDADTIAAALGSDSDAVSAVRRSYQCSGRSYKC
jgi:hypothetical protein